MLGSRSMYLDGWKATTDRVTSGVADEERLIEGSASIDDDTWALFNLEEDFAEANDLSEAHPELVRRLEQLWWAEAGRNHVLPMGNWMARALPDAVMAMSPPARPPMGRKVFLPGAGPIADEAVPMLAFGGRIEVDVQVPDRWRPRSALCTGKLDRRLGLGRDGWSACLSREFAQHTTCGSRGRHPSRRTQDRLVSSIALSAEGPSERLSVGRMKRKWERGRYHRGRSWAAKRMGMLSRLGYDSGFPVSEEYTPPFAMDRRDCITWWLNGGPMTRSHFEREIADIVHRD